jgi:hypothetical protein
MSIEHLYDEINTSILGVSLKDTINDRLKLKFEVSL